MKPLYAILFFIAGTMMIAVLNAYELPLLALMLISSGTILALDRWRNLRCFFISVLVGGACEAICVMLGVWKYSMQNYFLLPLWVPIAWGMAMVLFEEAFTKNVESPRFQKKAVAMSFGGALLTGFASASEFSALFSFVVVTLILVVSGFYKRSELKAGVMAGLFGAGMEVVCIAAGGWHYPVAIFNAPIWLPLAWFNAFLIMRRVVPR